MINHEWRKSSHSGQVNDCVELAVCVSHTVVRDTKARAAGVLALPTAPWSEFLAAVKSGELQH
jgi:hypothetical protein